MSNGFLSATVRLPAVALDWVRWALGLAVVGLVYYAYWEQSIGGTPAYQWLRTHWKVTSHYSHGPLIPLIALGLVWWKRRQLWAVRLQPSRWGLLVLVGAMLLYFAGVKASQAHTVVASFVVLLYGLVLALGGRELVRVLFFPITFLLLMIPLNFLDAHVGFPLRVFVAQAATGLLNWLGIPTYRLGPQATGIYSNVFQFDVADPCSGIRSLMALMTVTAAYGYVTQQKQWKRWVLFLSAMPLAVLGNLVRVVSIALVAQVYGQEVATRAYHDYSGYIVFAVALSAMVLVGLLLNFPYRRVLENWLKPLPVAGTGAAQNAATNFFEHEHERIADQP
jgi:exosortase